MIKTPNNILTINHEYQIPCYIEQMYYNDFNLFDNSSLKDSEFSKHN